MSDRQVRVLVVDDDDVVRRNLVAFLEDEGFGIVAASSGEDALALMAGRRFDRRATMAYAPYLALGAWIALYFGADLWRAYLA